MRINRSDLIEALRDNFEFWKIVAPVLLATIVACLAIIEFAFSGHPMIFIGWSITCLISGGCCTAGGSAKADKKPIAPANGPKASSDSAKF